MFIYKLTSPVKKVYIGKTKDIPHRWNEHRQEAIKGRKTHLYCAIRSYGWDSFLKEIIDTAESEEELNEKERFWISQFKATDPEKGYNLTEGGTGGNTWRFLSEERKKEIRLKRPPVSGETKAKLSKIMSARFATMPHHNKGKTAWNKGIPCSEEKKQHLRDLKKGKPSTAIWSEESRKKISEVFKGKPKTDKQRQLLREANLGKVLSNETRTKMSASRKGHLYGVGDVICPYCGKAGRSSAMFRWHFERCREKK